MDEVWFWRIDRSPQGEIRRFFQAATISKSTRKTRLGPRGAKSSPIPERAAGPAQSPADAGEDRLTANRLLEEKPE
jgi:hypothetical protein